MERVMPQTDDVTIEKVEKIAQRFFSEYDSLTDHWGLDYWAETILVNEFNWTISDPCLMEPPNWHFSDDEYWLAKYLIEEWDYWWKS